MYDSGSYFYFLTFCIISQALLFHIVTFLIIVKNENDEICPNSYLMYNSDKKELYMELMKTISFGEESDTNLHLSNEEDRDQFDKPLISQIVSIRWVIIEDLVFDISSFRHPMGNYVFEAI